ncbi:MAG: NifU family protein [Ignavibacteria bacterium]|nr:NifU family protein [Ignavibacteria bacterium]
MPETELNRENVERVLEMVRPFLQQDGGDVELYETCEDGIVKVRLLGNCKSCPLGMMTLRAGIERALMNEIPSVKRIEAVQ